MTERDAKTFWGLMALLLTFLLIGFIVGGVMSRGSGFNQGKQEGYRACLTDFKILEEH